jgi:hypothetical protein
MLLSTSCSLRPDAEWKPVTAHYRFACKEAWCCSASGFAFFHEKKVLMNSHLSALKKEIKNRAGIYVHIFRELSKEVGGEKAIEIFKKAVYARGKEKGVQLAARIQKPDLHELTVVFAENKGEMDAFGHEVVRENPDFVLLRLNHCPLVEAWEEAGISSEEKKMMCDIAHQVDFGKFETAGYKLCFNRRIADGHESCDLKVSLQQDARRNGAENMDS